MNNSEKNQNYKFYVGVDLSKKPSVYVLFYGV